MPSGQQSPSMRVVKDEKGAARQAFLDDVVSELSPWEWRDLHARLGGRKFNFDVFGQLPMELVHDVASYLNDLDIISSRRVCKRWQEILRSEELCRKVCFQHNFTNQRQLSTDMTWEAFLSHKSGIQHSLVHGRPWAKYVHRLSFGRDDLRNVVYHNGKLAVCRYFEGSDRLDCIDIYHFDTGEKSSSCVNTFLPQPVGPVDAMALSDSLFACILNRLLFIFYHSKKRTRTLLLPTSDYNKIAITEEKIVVWSTSCEDFTPLSIWDSTSKTLKHFRSRRTYEDFAVLRHADYVVLMSGISSVRTSKSIITKQYDSDGKLDSSLEMPCHRHAYIGSYKASNEFSTVLSSDTNPFITFASYRFSSTSQRLTSANFHYHTATRTLTSSVRRSPFPRTSEEVKNDLQRHRLHGFTIHSQNVFSIAWKRSSTPNDIPWFCHGSGRESFDEAEHEFYEWQGEKPLTHNTSEFCSINLAIYDQAKYWEQERYARLWKCCGDERFLIKLFDDRFEVYCFDEDFHMKRENKAYRTERDRRAAERSKKRQQEAEKI